MNDFKGRHFQGEIILWAVRWYCKYGISYRELEEMLEERGIEGQCLYVERADYQAPMESLRTLSLPINRMKVCNKKSSL